MCPSSRTASSTDQALEELLGRTRAAILEAAADGRGTTEPACRLGISPATVSQRTAVLRNAGLLATRREGKAVLHTVTPLGTALLEPGSRLLRPAARGTDGAAPCRWFRRGSKAWPRPGSSPPAPRTAVRSAAGTDAGVLRAADVVQTFGNAATGSCLDDSRQYGLRGYGCNGGVHQQWNVHGWNDGTRRFRSMATGECPDDSRYGLRTVRCDGSRNRTWR
ncbi:hypothetical protein [Streptomyces sp. NPDC088757]|uniref:hypothetical protein n=1 Tax=Streptomyces sp. NPDC088757 TaxID=3365889 RepID=UPI003807D43D